MRSSTAVLAAIFSFSAPLLTAQDSLFYTATTGPASIGINVTPRGHQVSLGYKGFLNVCEGGYLKPINVHFIFHDARGTNIFIRKMSGECRTNSHPYASGEARFQAFGSPEGFDVLWPSLEKVLGEDDGSVRFELAFERDHIWDSAAGQNYPVAL